MPQRWADALWRAWDGASAHDDGELQAIAVDNASGDGTAGQLRRHAPWLEVVELPRNVGFAAGCNAGLALVRNASIVILLNPDVILRDDFFERLGALECPEDLAAIGPAVLNADGQVEQSARRFPRLSTGFFGRTTLLSRLFPQSGLVRRELRADLDGGAQDVDWVSGACLIIPRKSLEKVGFLDERYFLYWEDADWCRRAHDLGLKVRYEPQLVIHHYQGTSTSSRVLGSTVEFHRSAFRYYRAHVARSRLAVAMAAIVLSIRCVFTFLLRARLAARKVEEGQSSR